MNREDQAQWQPLYLAAMAEARKPDAVKLEMAEEAMRKRTAELRRRRDTDSILEMQAIAAGLEKLASRKSMVHASVGSMGMANPKDSHGTMSR